MNSIYIHIPFCRRACYYCDFHFSTSLRYKTELLDALSKEIVLRKDFFSGNSGKIESVYFGGGTPSLLTYDELMEIFETVWKNFTVANNAEVTIEANPDDLTQEKIRQLKTTPVNRLSIGVQSFFDADLKYLHRIHNAMQAENSVRLARDAGFDNISIDLIYGVPGQTDKQWKKNIKKFISLGIPHLSAYALTVEPATPLFHLIRRKKMIPPLERQVARQYRQLMDFMRQNDFIHYEISNFSREGFISLHNKNYWCNGFYLGLGPSAHSYNGKIRRWNIAQNIRYIEALKKRRLPYEKETLTIPMKYNEYIMTSLRTMWGCDIEIILKTFGRKYYSGCMAAIQKYIDRNEIVKKGGKLFLTNTGKLFADRISAELFV
ncbi:MAG: radical SAM family heme chaperone HemW [Bacteroidetes bacterium]|nr:radical SAM family heme chaperone HemW [Bacteroidota bacterium]